jgi:hypothetical protein
MPVRLNITIDEDVRRRPSPRLTKTRPASAAPDRTSRLAGDRDRGLAHVSRPPRRGDVFWVNLDPVVGTEIRKTRPALSNDSCNRYGTRVVVLPITSNTVSPAGLSGIRFAPSTRLGWRLAPVGSSPKCAKTVRFDGLAALTY